MSKRNKSIIVVSLLAAIASVPMTPQELIELSKTDPQAAMKFLNSHVQDEHNEVDKLLNLLAHGKYE